MNAIKRIINENLYDKLSLRYIEKIAMKYFSTFDDDDLKILYLTKAYERLDPVYVKYVTLLMCRITSTEWNF